MTEQATTRFPREEQLRGIIAAAEVTMKYGHLDPPAALDRAVIDVRETWRGLRTSGTAMSPELIEDWDKMLGVADDIANGYVSPTVGNLRDYALTWLTHISN